MSPTASTKMKTGESRIIGQPNRSRLDADERQLARREDAEVMPRYFCPQHSCCSLLWNHFLTPQHREPLIA
jgi:hypothetical protein